MPTIAPGSPSTSADERATHLLTLALLRLHDRLSSGPKAHRRVGEILLPIVSCAGEDLRTEAADRYNVYRLRGGALGAPLSGTDAERLEKMAAGGVMSEAAHRALTIVRARRNGGL